MPAMVSSRSLAASIRLILFTAAVQAAACAGAANPSGEPLPGTDRLKLEGDISSLLVEGADRFLLKQLDDSIARRARHWNRDVSSAEKYNKSVEPNRRRLAQYLGVVDARLPATGLEYVATVNESALVGRGSNFKAYAIRWPVLPGIYGEGLYLVPKGKPVAYTIALPDADQTPEMLAGLVPGTAPESQFARRLAESGCQVVVPMLINRADTYSLSAAGTQASNLPHREFIYRQAFEMGRHIIGYEVQKVLALVDYFDRKDGQGKPVSTLPVGIFGYAEGGLLALSAAALDPRIDAVTVSAYFRSRQNVWQEPGYRNVWGLLDEFGDAELATLVAPRSLVIEAARGPEVDGPPKPTGKRMKSAAPGKLDTPPLVEVERELTRARQLVHGLAMAKAFELVASGGGDGPAGSPAALEKFLAALSPETRLAPTGGSPENVRPTLSADARLKRQLDEMTDFTQKLMHESCYTRVAFFEKHGIVRPTTIAGASNVKPIEASRWTEAMKPLKEYFYDEVIGRFDRPLLPAKPRTRKVYDEPKYVGYEVVMDVFPDLIAYGVLLVPKDIKPGERRPVVVCQHGLEGRPQDTIEANVPGERFYHRFAARLAERGFITYAPQNLYIFQDRFRTLQRKGNVLKKTLFSMIVPQHQQTVDWLASLPMVDGQRIGFYGLSYGGKTAMRVPALVDGYALSICSGDFNEWIWKNTSDRWRGSYLTKGEYEIFEFDLGNTFNYAEMTALIAPRPFMVERGHRDGVAPDEWVAYEFAKVRLMYADLKLPERTEIEFFDGPHEIHGVGTFAFLHKHLRWPEPKAQKQVSAAN